MFILFSLMVLWSKYKNATVAQTKKDKNNVVKSLTNTSMLPDKDIQRIIQSIEIINITNIVIQMILVFFFIFYIYIITILYFL